MTQTSVPDWQDFNGGTRSRVALWLHTEVGANGTFTKADLRAAFPGTEQIDRRMRDLRDAGWIIATYATDRSLEPDELRLVKIGGNVWERSFRSTLPKAPTAKERQATFLADGFACVSCGIGAGDPFPDDPLRTARLSAARRPGLDDETQLVTQCDRCLAGRAYPDMRDLVGDIKRLDRDSLRELQKWINASKRTSRPVDSIWSKYQGLSKEQKQRLAQEVDSAVDHAP